MATNLTYLDSSTYCLCQCQCLTYLVEWITCDCDVISYLASFPGQFPPFMWPGYEAGCDVWWFPTTHSFLRSQLKSCTQTVDFKCGQSQASALVSQSQVLIQKAGLSCESGSARLGKCQVSGWWWVLVISTISQVFLSLLQPPTQKTAMV